MKFEKIFTSFLLGAAVLSLLASCSSEKRSSKVLKIAASPVPHAEILKVIQPECAKQGIQLQIFEIEDYQIPNRLLSEREIDANFFQHTPFLEEQNKHLGSSLTVLGKVHIEPLGIYSKKIGAMSSLKEGATVAIPNDPTNEARALHLLSETSLITLVGGTQETATPLDIVDNPKHLVFQEVDAALTARVLPEVDISIIPANYALQVHLSPIKDALFYEDAATSPYANVIAIRKGDNREEIKILLTLIQSPKLYNYIVNTYEGAIVPAFKN